MLGEAAPAVTVVRTGSDGVIGLIPGLMTVIVGAVWMPLHAPTNP
jgi:hypothetical protein